MSTSTEIDLRSASFWRSPLGISVAIGLSVNLLLIAAWFWSRGGQGIDVRVEAAGDRYTAWVDGKQIASGQFASPPGEMFFSVQIESTEALPSLPTPRGIDYIRVTDSQSGDVVISEEFSTVPDPAVWTTGRGSFVIADGHAGSLRSPSILNANAPLPANFRADLHFDNVTDITLNLSSTNATDTRATLAFRPFRHYDGQFSIANTGDETDTKPFRVELNQSGTIKSQVAMVLSFIPAIYGLIAGALIVVFALQFLPLPTVASERPQSSRLKRVTVALPAAAAATIACAAFGVTLWLMLDYNSGIPHVPDEVSYLFQAKVLASGRFTVPSSPVPESFDFFHPPLIINYKGDWFSIYPFGHTIMLSIGEVFGAPWIMPPLIGAITIGAVFATGRAVWNTRTGLLAAALFALSPFFLMTASNYMSHGTAAMYISLSLLFIAVRDRRPLLFPAFSGVFFGLLYNTRPLTAFSLIPAFALIFLVLLIQRRADWRNELRSQSAWAAGALLLLALSGLYNWGTTGDPFLTGYSASGDVSEVIGFGGKHSAAIGIQNEQVQVTMLMLVLHNWPLWIGLALVFLPFALGTRLLWDWFLLFAAFLVTAVYTLYEAPGIMHGPRYWYEALPFLMLLSARGADLLATTLTAVSAEGRKAAFGIDRRATWAGVAVVYIFVLSFAVIGSRDWLAGDGGDWVVDKMPARAKDLRGFNGANDGAIKAVEEANLQDALVLASASTSWQSYGTLFWKNSPDLDTSIVYARDLPAKNAALFALYPNRRVYYSDYAQGILVPYGWTVDADLIYDLEDVPVAGAIPTPTIVPTPTPDPLAQTRRDGERIAHLEEIASALDEYFERNGRYPPAENIQTLCVYSFDSGCALKDVLDPLPTDPSPGRAYWLNSDGLTFYFVVARMETPPPPSDCPPLPGDFGDPSQYYCLASP